MPFDGTLDFVRALEAEGELRRISVEVNPVLEMTAMADRLVKSGGPAVVFENATGSQFSVAIGMYGNCAKAALATLPATTTTGTSPRSACKLTCRSIRPCQAVINDGIFLSDTNLSRADGSTSELAAGANA